MYIYTYINIHTDSDIDECWQDCLEKASKMRRFQALRLVCHVFPYACMYTYTYVYTYHEDEKFSSASTGMSRVLTCMHVYIHTDVYACIQMYVCIRTHTFTHMYEKESFPAL